MARHFTELRSGTARDPERDPSRAGLWLLGLVGFVLACIAAPVVFRGGLLADEYFICMRPINDGGYGDYLQAIWQDTGVVRPARFIELFLISKTCTTIPFGFAILVPLALKVASAFLLYRLLRDLDLRDPWPAIGTAIWLLEPVGTEAALWPAALHVLLGLTLALAALRLFRRGALGWGATATFAAALSVEQVLFAIPLAVWLVTPSAHRRRATAIAGVMVVAVLIAYWSWPGTNVRQAVPLAERIANVATEPEWYLFFPAMGLGLYSGAIAVLWALPWSLAVLTTGTFVGSRTAPTMLSGSVGAGLGSRAFRNGLVATAALVVLVNLPLIVTEVGYSARTFTPTWLVVSSVAAIAGARVAWRRFRLVGALAGAFAAVALLSLTLSASVRVRTDRFDEAAAHWIADRTRNGDIVAVCDVGRTAVEPAPLGAFHLHSLHSASGEWIEYFTGRVVDVRRSGERYWGARCPDLGGADLVVRFPELVEAVDDPADG